MSVFLNGDGQIHQLILFICSSFTAAAVGETYDVRTYGHFGWFWVISLATRNYFKIPLWHRCWNSIKCEYLVRKSFFYSNLLLTPSGKVPIRWFCCGNVPFSFIFVLDINPTTHGSTQESGAWDYTPKFGYLGCVVSFDSFWINSVISAGFGFVASG